MNREERAKQFMPFDALKGLREELKKREEKRLIEKKIELSEERVLELSQKIVALDKGDQVKITFFYRGHYVELTGKIQAINCVYKYIAINDSRIPFEDVLEIEYQNA